MAGYLLLDFNNIFKEPSFVEVFLGLFYCLKAEFTEDKFF